MNPIPQQPGYVMGSCELCVHDREVWCEPCCSICGEWIGDNCKHFRPMGPHDRRTWRRMCKAAQQRVRCAYKGVRP